MVGIYFVLQNFFIFRTLSHHYRIQQAFLILCFLLLSIIHLVQLLYLNHTCRMQIKLWSLRRAGLIVWAFHVPIPNSRNFKIFIRGSAVSSFDTSLILQVGSLALRQSQTWRTSPRQLIKANQRLIQSHVCILLCSKNENNLNLYELENILSKHNHNMTS